ncbi:MAG: bis(5'-nucleosyl)-tetraphosphatase, symmetrical [marine bacterium B5-7]|nr:MAG: bis(5'-nucleosyl)-tetraphosphatase, symmetrical [marine bacterium B5-7]
MSIYVIGDVQGCFDPLQRLLAACEFEQNKDTLWFAGDLVNRGPDSLKVLQFVRSLPKVVTVLGNHDLHMLAVCKGVREMTEEDTFQDVMESDEKDALCDWLRQQPLLHHQKQWTLVHAGLHPSWDLKHAQQYAKQLEEQLRGDDYLTFLSTCFCSAALSFADAFTDKAKNQFLVNVFTRMRFCDAKGRLDLQHKGDLSTQPDGMLPWFSQENRKTHEEQIAFGHWASLRGVTNTPNVHALDTGCVWGEQLTALRLEDQQLFSVSA